MNCNKAKQQMIFLAEGSLTNELAQAMNNHLQQCKECSHVFIELQKTISIMDEPGKVEIYPWFAARVEQQLIIQSRPAENQTIFKLKPVFRYLRWIPVAASLIIALWVGTAIGSRLIEKYADIDDLDELAITFYDEQSAEELYQQTFEAFLLINGDN